MAAASRMPEQTPKDLGKVVSVHAISPLFMQRAAFIAVLAFLFFLATMFIFYLRAGIGYFLLATAFLLIYIVTMISLVMQKRSVVTVHENGLAFRKFRAAWSEIESFRSRPDEGGKVRVEVKTISGGSATFPESLQNTAELIRIVRTKLSDKQKSASAG